MRKSRKPGDVHALSRHYSRAITFIMHDIFFESCFLIVFIAFCGFKSVLSPFFVPSRLSRLCIYKFGHYMVSFTMDTRLSYLWINLHLSRVRSLVARLVPLPVTFTKRILSREYTFRAIAQLVEQWIVNDFCSFFFPTSLLHARVYY